MSECVEAHVEGTTEEEAALCMGGPNMETLGWTWKFEPIWLWAGLNCSSKALCQKFTERW